MNKQLLRQFKSKVSQVNLNNDGEKSSVEGFRFSRNSKNGANSSKRRSKSEYTWNSNSLFLTVAILVTIVYSMVQLGIGVYLDKQSRILQEYREEEAFLIEENQSINSKVAKHKSKLRVEIAAKKDLKMKKSESTDLVKIIDNDISAGLLEND